MKEAFDDAVEKLERAITGENNSDRSDFEDDSKGDLEKASTSDYFVRIPSDDSVKEIIWSRGGSSKVHVVARATAQATSSSLMLHSYVT